MYFYPPNSMSIFNATHVADGDTVFAYGIVLTMCKISCVSVSDNVLMFISSAHILRTLPWDPESMGNFLNLYVYSLTSLGCRTY